MLNTLTSIVSECLKNFKNYPIRETLEATKKSEPHSYIFSYYRIINH